MKRAFLLFPLVILIILIAGGCDRKVVNEYADDTPTQGVWNCFNCHGDNDFELVAARYQYDMSKHATGNTFNRNRLSGYQSCEGCHTNEGFVARMTGEPADGNEFTPIACFTCHAPHTTGTLQLRSEAPVTLENDAIFNVGAGNLCANCHHSRRDVNTYVVANDTLDSHYGPHHSNQSDMLLGTNGYEYEDYDYITANPHLNAEDGCPQCHKADPLYGTGGHTFWLANDDEDYENVSGCNKGCHEGNVDELDYKGEQTEVMDMLDDLEALLLNAGLLEWIDEDGEMILEPTEDRVVMTADSAGALFNYMFVREDRSEGIHNLNYAKGLIESSIEFMSNGAGVKKIIATGLPAH